MGRPIALIAGKDPVAEVSGGHSSYVRAHARAARAAGYEPHIFCVSNRQEVAEAEYGIIHRIKSPYRPFRQLMVIAHGPLIASAVENFVIAGSRSPIIHSFAVWGYAGVLANRHLRSKGITSVPIVSSYTTYGHELVSKVEGVASNHGALSRLRYKSEYRWAKLFVERCERQAYVESRLVTVNYESVRRLIIDKYGADVSIRKLPYTSESAFLKELPSSEQDKGRQRRTSGVPLIVAVSRHEANKGVDLLLQALAELKKAAVPFQACLVGGGMLLAKHRELLERLKLGNAVTITGTVPDVRPYLREADLFVLPSLNESSGSLALIEALQEGLPVIASDVDGIPEDVITEVNAILVRPDDVEDLARAIRRVVTDEDLRERLGRAGRQAFSDRFSAKVFIAAVQRMYSELESPP
jgi:glycosyltransferase involved in cell wall biosynthesis